MKRFFLGIGLAFGIVSFSGCESASSNYGSTPDGTAYYAREPVSQIDRAVNLQEKLGSISRSQIR